jgi:hypothetical protein
VSDRILCLIIDHDPAEAWRETYDCHRRLWHRCLDICPWVDGYFIRSSPSIGCEHAVASREFVVRGQESMSTILHKTVRALDVLLTDHTWVVRTNISSLYDFPLLRRMPISSGVYSGALMYGTYITGSGILLSADVARLLVESRDSSTSEWDDVSIGQLLSEKGVRPEHRDMFIYDYSKGLDQIEVGKHYHYRLRDYSDPQRTPEREAAEAVFKRIYGAGAC